MNRLINADGLIETVKSACELADDTEATKWYNWFIEVINSEVIRQNKVVSERNQEIIQQKIDALREIEE